MDDLSLLPVDSQINDVGAIPSILSNSGVNFSITLLLPYNPETKIPHELGVALKEYKMLLIAAKKSMADFIAGKLSSFDSLVGENSCQIRATILSIIAESSFSTERTTLLKIISVLEKVEKAENDSQIIHKVLPLSVFLTDNDLDLRVNYRELFLICSYVLTKVRIILPPNPLKPIVRNEMTETKRIKEISPVGSSFSRDLVKRLRSVISSISVNFVQQSANNLLIPKSIIDMVSEKYCMSHNKFGRLKCLPCFWYTYVLMHYSIKMKIPLVLVAKKINEANCEVDGSGLTLYFKIIDGSYQEVPSSEMPQDAAAIVIIGSAYKSTMKCVNLETWRSQMLACTPMNLILAYAAAHRQYPDEAKDSIVIGSNCQSYKYYKNKSSEWGCSLDNPSLFFLVHAYSEKIKNIKT